jgi:hypothetical protein
MRDGLPDEKIEHLRKLCRGNDRIELIREEAASTRQRTSSVGRGSVRSTPSEWRPVGFAKAH